MAHNKHVLTPHHIFTVPFVFTPDMPSLRSSLLSEPPETRLRPRRSTPMGLFHTARRRRTNVKLPRHVRGDYVNEVGSNYRQNSPDLTEPLELLRKGKKSTERSEKRVKYDDGVPLLVTDGGDHRMEDVDMVMDRDGSVSLTRTRKESGKEKMRGILELPAELIQHIFSFLLVGGGSTGLAMKKREPSEDVRAEVDERGYRGGVVTRRGSRVSLRSETATSETNLNGSQSSNHPTTSSNTNMNTDTTSTMASVLSTATTSVLTVGDGWGMEVLNYFLVSKRIYALIHRPFYAFHILHRRTTLGADSHFGAFVESIQQQRPSIPTPNYRMIRDFSGSYGDQLKAGLLACIVAEAIQKGWRPNIPRRRYKPQVDIFFFHRRVTEEDIIKHPSPRDAFWQNSFPVDDTNELHRGTSGIRATIRYVNDPLLKRTSNSLGVPNIPYLPGPYMTSLYKKGVFHPTHTAVHDQEDGTEAEEEDGTFNRFQTLLTGAFKRTHWHAPIYTRSYSFFILLPSSSSSSHSVLYRCTLPYVPTTLRIANQRIPIHPPPSILMSTCFSYRSCRGCLRTSPDVDILMCSRCRWGWYCSVECQRVEYAKHRCVCAWVSRGQQQQQVQSHHRHHQQQQQVNGQHNQTVLGRRVG